MNVSNFLSASPTTWTHWLIVAMLCYVYVHTYTTIHTTYAVYTCHVIQSCILCLITLTTTMHYHSCNLLAWCLNCIRYLILIVAGILWFCTCYSDQIGQIPIISMYVINVPYFLWIRLVHFKIQFWFQSTNLKFHWLITASVVLSLTIWAHSTLLVSQHTIAHKQCGILYSFNHFPTQSP